MALIMKRFIYIILAFSLCFALVACNNELEVEPIAIEVDPEPEMEAVPEYDSVFGGIRTRTIGIGEMGFVTVGYDSFTDEELVNFFHEHISDSGFNWFNVEFGDGTGYFFGGSRNLFTHSALDSDGRMLDEVGRSGWIRDDYIDWIEFD